MPYVGREAVLKRGAAEYAALNDALRRVNALMYPWKEQTSNQKEYELCDYDKNVSSVWG